jgi:ubiquinone/menaquinone biosynthesis C-methylase UbiE
MMQRFALALLALASVFAQDQHPVSGRVIAPVMGVGGADWLTRPEREAEEHPSVALDEIGIAPGSTVADIGAGVGYYSLLLARRVGPGGKVYANDIQQAMLDRLEARARAGGFKNIIPVLGVEDDPKLPANSVDVALLVDVYHEFSKPQAMLRHLRESLKPAGRLVLLEYRAEDPNVPIRPEHKMTVKQVVAELKPEGFRLVKRSEKLPWQHILIFGKAD